uniref:NADH-ubiquinone oxidoreductase chain 2 n=1 Tax=Megachile strupigera TaxID=1735309 RepID=A0A0P0IGU6_9HYME|nr:NADH dehydrogenase subunit 2 [Megachile strupigera]
MYFNDLMMNKNYLFYPIYYTLMSIIVFMLSIDHHLIKWLFFEVFSLIFISYMNYSSKNKMNSLIYFTISSFFSMLLLYIILNNFYQDFKLIITLPYDKKFSFISLLIQLILMMKMGMFPFHNWMIYMYASMSWKNIYIFSTLNKFISIYLMYSFTQMNWFLMLMIAINAVYSAILAMKEVSIKKIMGFSSMNQTSLLIMMAYMDFVETTIYYIVYLFNSCNLYHFFDRFNITTKINLINMFNYNSFKIIYIIFTISFSMLPLTSFFFMKWFMFQNMVFENYNLMIFLFILSISNVLMLWNYLNLLNYQLTPNKVSKIYKFINKKLMKSYYLYIFLSIIFNFSTIVMMFF